MHECTFFSGGSFARHPDTNWHKEICDFTSIFYTQVPKGEAIQQSMCEFMTLTAAVTTSCATHIHWHANVSWSYRALVPISAALINKAAERGMCCHSGCSWFMLLHTVYTTAHVQALSLLKHVAAAYNLVVKPSCILTCTLIRRLPL